MFGDEDDFDIDLGHPRGTFDDNYEEPKPWPDLDKLFREYSLYYNPERFESLWHRLHDNKRPKVDPNFVKAHLDMHYETGRYYHDQSHINSLLREFNELKEKQLLEHPNELELAIYAHDVIYDAKAKDNESQSANWICSLLERSGVDKNKAERVRSLIEASDHKNPPKDNDSAYFLDIDLSIFGKTEEVYDKYAEAIRKEYSWVSEEDYRKGRSQVLRHFLAREKIYYTEFFRNKYEYQARINLERELISLENKLI
jgi:predicted metal-dependent HD superfamily phosphohydrolase